MTNFGNSLKHGNQYIYQSMPRMLTLWLDYGSEVTEVAKVSALKSEERGRGDRSEVTVEAMRTFLRTLNKV